MAGNQHPHHHGGRGTWFDRLLRRAGIVGCLILLALLSFCVGSMSNGPVPGSSAQVKQVVVKSGVTDLDVSGYAPGSHACNPFRLAHQTCTFDKNGTTAIGNVGAPGLHFCYSLHFGADQTYSRWRWDPTKPAGARWVDWNDGNEEPGPVNQQRFTANGDGLVTLEYWLSPDQSCPDDTPAPEPTPSASPTPEPSATPTPLPRESG